MSAIKRIGLLTGGGDCPGLNAAIRAVVRSAIYQYGWNVLGFKDGYSGLVLNDYIPLDYHSVSGLLDKGGTILGTSNRDNPFHFQTEVTLEGPVFSDMRGQVLETIEKNRVDALIVIGGDGTLTAANIFSQMGIPVVGVPKTIDNDLIGTDYTIGFNTAVDTAADAIDKLHSTAESHHRLMVLEVMGRYAGWIALTAGMAAGADIILLPELPYDSKVILSAIEQRVGMGRHFSIIVVSEGVKPFNGNLISRRIVESSPDPLRLGGVGPVIAEDLEALSGIDSRAVVLGHLQRGGRPIPFDRILASRFGAAATEAVARGNFGQMIALSGSKITTVSLAEIAGKQKLVPPDHELIRIGRAMGICFGI
jgi:phosphofructokinase-like protein